MPRKERSRRYFAWRRPRRAEESDFEVLVGSPWVVAAVGVGLGMAAWLLSQPPSRRAPAILRLVAASGAAGALALLEGVRGAACLAVTRVELPLNDLAQALDGLVIAQLSDLHLGHPLATRVVRRAVTVVRETQPDLIVLTGDFIAYRRHLPVLGDVLKSLTAPYGLFAILGNHDYWTAPAAISRCLRKLGIAVLVNEHRILTLGDARLVVAGVDDLWAGKPDLTAALAGVPSRAPILLLAHEPDFAATAAQSPVAVQLSGHSHGGHIRLPALGPLLLPRHGVWFDRGLRRVGNMWLYVSHGLGGWPLRLGCRVEVTLFTLRAAS